MSGRMSRRDGRRTRGQGLVEYAMTVPVFLLVLLGLLEFGFAFSHHMTMEYATREGARTGASLNDGTAQVACNGNNDDNVDNQVMAAVQRVLTAAGSQVVVGNVGEVRIYKADANGQQIGSNANIWKPGQGTQTVGGVALLFTRTTFGWNPCSRDGVSTGTVDPVDSIGVSITYDYKFVTPLGALLKIAGPATLHMSDRTVMALNPDPQ